MDNGIIIKPYVEIINEIFPDCVLGEENNILSVTDIEEEYNSLKYGVAIRIGLDASILKLHGADVITFLHRISTNDIKDLEKNQFAKTLFTTDKGRLLDKTLLLRFEYESYLIGSQSSREHLVRWLDRYIITEDIKVENSFDKFGVLEIYGPQANSFLTIICGDDADEINEKEIKKIQLEGLSFFAMKIVENNIEKYLIFFYKVIGEKLIQLLVESKSVLDFAIVGDEAFNLFRIENLIPSSPNEIQDKFIPNELNLLNDISLNKGCFIGQEIIARLETYDKVQRQLCKFTSDVEIDTQEYVSIITENGKDAGVVTSCAKKLNGRYLCLGLLRKKYLDEKEFILKDLDIRVKLVK